MSTILFISNNCLHCNNLKKYEIYNKLKKCNIDNSNVRCKLPKFIKSVPTLMIKNNDDIILYMENELINWFNENSNNTSNKSNNSNDKSNNIQNNSNNKSNDIEQEPGSSNELWGGFSSEYSFMNDNENNNISESFYSNLNTNFNINTPSDNNDKYNDNDNNNKKAVNDRYEQLMQERDKEFKPVARLG